MDAPVDIAVIGAGPAGLAASAACHAAGLSVALVAPAPDEPWTNGYGLWPDELVDPALAACVAAAWPAVGVRFGAGDAHRVERTYARIDNARLRAELRSRVPDLRIVAGEAIGATHDRVGSTVHLAGGGSVRARIVVDAAGAASPLAVRHGAPSLFQSAWGEVVEADLGTDVPRWMDLSGPDRRPASFLYALPLAPGQWLLEETVLAGPAMPLDVLAGRLHARLAGEGIRVGRPVATERVRIPLDAPVPRPQRVVAFGAAGGMVHPATGYSVARALNAAPDLASALAAGLAESPDAGARAAYRALWPADRLRSRELHLYGAEVVAGLDQAETAAFFRAFFSRLPARTVRGWLADALPPGELARAMATVFPGFPRRVQWKAASGGRLRHLLAAALP